MRGALVAHANASWRSPRGHARGPDERCCIHQAGWFEKSQGPSFLWVFSTVTSMIYWVIFSGVLAGEKRRVTLIWIMSPRHQAPTATFSLLSINNAQPLTLRVAHPFVPLPLSSALFLFLSSRTNSLYLDFFFYTGIYTESFGCNTSDVIWFQSRISTLPAVCTFAISRSAVSRIKASDPIYLASSPVYPSRSRLARESAFEMLGNATLYHSFRWKNTLRLMDLIISMIYATRYRNRSARSEFRIKIDDVLRRYILSKLFFFRSRYN